VASLSISDAIEAPRGRRPIQIAQLDAVLTPLQQIEKNSLHDVLSLLRVAQHPLTLAAKRRAIASVKFHNLLTHAIEGSDVLTLCAQIDQDTVCGVGAGAAIIGAATQRLLR